MSLAPTIFDLAHIERAILALDKKISRILEVIEKYEKDMENEY